MKAAPAIAVSILITTLAIAGVTILFFEPPGGVEAQPASINSSGTIVGRYQSSNGDGIEPGFIRDASGKFTSLYAPFSGTTETTPVWINDQGQIAGWYSNGTTVFSGFFLDTDGNYTSFDPPGSDRTQPQSMNAAGEISGVYTTSGTSGDVGFLRDSVGNFSSFGGPGSCGDAVLNAVISASGEIAGTCSYNGGKYSYFIRSAAGNLTEYLSPFGGEVIEVTAINDSNMLAGFYAESSSSTQAYGFWQDSTGVHSFSYPGAMITVATGINSAGIITGYYSGTDNVKYGFLRNPSGSYISFSAAREGQGLFPTAISVRGQVTGYFLDTDGNAYGFLLSR